VAESDLPALSRLLEGVPHGVVGSFIAAGPDGGEVSVTGTELGSGREAAARFEEAWKRGCDR
jgi:hypothetical protein